ncbi:hypothetical protein [Salinigranum halophilum]|uniref:hypothetical protein n=1 Tax=Salinigranum halophilum TaxID=2565931 RepID=UPI0010A85350|nr:hypothetical protein [Salinigranum halophilum]
MSQQSGGQPNIEVHQASLTRSEIDPGQSVGVRVTVENTGSADGETTLSMQIGNTGTSETVRVGAGQTKTVTLGMQVDKAGEQIARVNGERIGTLTVGDTTSQGPILPPDVLGIAGIGLGALAYLGGWVYVINQSPRLQRFFGLFTEWLTGLIVIVLFVGLLIVLGVGPLLAVSVAALVMIGIHLGQWLI